MIISDDLWELIKQKDGIPRDISFERNVWNIDRRSAIIRQLKQADTSKIVHIGCCGHLKKIDEQVNSGISLQLMLTESFGACNVIGFDIDDKAVQKMRGYTDTVFCCDMISQTELANSIITEKFGTDRFCILIPDVLEHVPNPVTFLDMIIRNYTSADEVLITVPNAYGFGRIKSMLLNNTEQINIDHKYMFTPFTILKTIGCVDGIRPREILFMDHYKIAKILRAPVCANSIMVRCSIER